MLGVSDGIPDDILQEDLEYTTGLFVDQTRDTLYTTAASKTTNRLGNTKCNVSKAKVAGFPNEEQVTYRLRNTLDVITKDLTVTLCTTFAETLSSTSTKTKTRAEVSRRR
ncbi:hypothetical protein ACEPAF_3380 [Sanghuangporus sanghuang]|uniref:Histone H4 (ISS) n=1 Tax=Sanghuangporus baumii TaxID=108892 RepID=A0A9Q5HUC8_SANBA|nr:Histone H4 (ISS) [Sanghuangporus baumii]